MTGPGIAASAVLQALESSGITHVMGIPDNASAALFDLLADHPDIHLVTVTREGEAFAVAAGVWIGRGRPLVVIQNTGLLESGDALRGTAVRMSVPLPLLITGRGYEKMARAGLEPGAGLDRDLLTRPDVDSAALLTEPTLSAWGVPFARADGPEDHELVAATIARARSEERPVALLLTGPLE